MSLDHHVDEPTAIRTNLDPSSSRWKLSRSSWLITSLSPGGGEKMPKHGVSAGNVAAPSMCLSELKQKVSRGPANPFDVVAIQEARLDGFWIYRVLAERGS